MSFRKPFDQDLYNKHDAKTKALVTWFYEDQFHVKLVPNPFTEFGADLMALKKIGSNKYINYGWVEVEHKMADGWTSESYKYDDIRISARKLKFKDTEVVLVNKDGSSICIITSDVLRTSPLTFIKNKYSRGEDEMFISVSLDLCKWFFNLNGDNNGRF